MKTKLLTATLVAAMLVPAGAAGAQTRDLQRERQDVREERRDVREAQRDLDQARRYGDREDVRDARRDVQEERRDVREERREVREEWREYRERNRQLYRAPRFTAPFRYQRFGTGASIDARYWGDRYRVSNYSRYRLPAPGRYQRYVRHYNDLLLVNTRTGRVVRVYNNLYW
jgi:Ni/Co efflux regulator RcnB